MKFILATIPIRSKPDTFPPVGATSLLDVLIKQGYAPILYDIDGMRYGFDQIVEFFRAERPDVVGISAVVSTAYLYTKELTHAIKRVSPQTKIILGGCLAASAEILMRKCPIDVCVVGEGEKILLNLVTYWEKYHDFDPSREEFCRIRGIAFIDKKDDFIFTGYEKQLLSEELPQPNYELLSRYSDINIYISDPMGYSYFRFDDRSYQAHRKGKKCCVVMTGKGCISRCTFCHRWVQGYRSYPVDAIVATMKRLIEKYDIGFFVMGDESFGANPGMLEEFVKAVEPLDILFKIDAIRFSTVYRNPDIVRKLKKAGCVAMIFGLESGSDKILTIMEKGATSQQNSDISKLLSRERMNTVHQLVIGMPGESEETIRETIECMKRIIDADYYPVVSINYFQSLPGTPAYEFMRSKGLIGKTLDDEEAYLIKVSNVDAGISAHYVNISEENISKVLLWQHRIRAEVLIHWYKLRRWKPFKKPVNQSRQDEHKRSDPISMLMWHAFSSTRVYFRMVSLLDGPFWALMLFLMRMRLYGAGKAVLFTLGIKRESDRRPFIIKEPKSLRKILAHPESSSLSISEANMLPLRNGR